MLDKSNRFEETSPVNGTVGGAGKGNLDPDALVFVFGFFRGGAVVIVSGSPIVDAHGSSSSYIPGIFGGRAMRN